MSDSAEVSVGIIIKSFLILRLLGKRRMQMIGRLGIKVE